MIAVTTLLVLVSFISSSSGATITPPPQYPIPIADQYGPNTKEPYCHKVERIEFKDYCEPYKEETCWTQNKETCATENYKNCTGVIITELERVCFSITEMLCSLEELIHYENVEETYQLMRCFTATDRVCDTTYSIDTLKKDDYQCLTVQAPNCYQEEQTINDITCTDTIEFKCGPDKSAPAGAGGYGSKEIVCARFPKKDCYKVPRKVLVEVCEEDFYDYCEKFTNIVPFPVEDQNCHFEPKKICEIREMSNPKQAKKYSYTKDCKKVSREICDQVEKKLIQPHCNRQERLQCKYVPEKKCEVADKVYCHKEEEIVVEEVCENKFDTKYL